LRHPGRAHRHRCAARRSQPARPALQGPADQAELTRGNLCRPGEGEPMNREAIRSIYVFEMSRALRTWQQSIVAPVISTSLYFVVFGAAIGSRITEIEGVSYGAFI